MECAPGFRRGVFLSFYLWSKVVNDSIQLGITRVAQASSVNVMTLCYSLEPQIAYFPIDEDHPCEPDEPYGLSKQSVSPFKFQDNSLFTYSTR